MLSRRALLTGSIGAITAGYCRGLWQTQRPSRLETFRRRRTGRVITQGSDGYERARRTASFSPTTDNHPALIARCATREDVAVAIEYARESGLDVAIRSGGHDVLGASVRSPLRKMRK